MKKRTEKKDNNLAKEKSRKTSGKPLAIFKAITSFFVWGFGQLLNGQIIKALFFFVFFMSFIGIELATTNTKPIDPYDRFYGKSLNYDGSLIENRFSQLYKIGKDDYLKKVRNDADKLEDAKKSYDEFESKYYFKKNTSETEKKDKQLLTYDLLINEVANDIVKHSPSYYTFIGENEKHFINDNDEIKSILYDYSSDEYLYIDTKGNYYRLRESLDEETGVYTNIYYRSYLLDTSEYKDGNNKTPILKSNIGLTQIQKTGKLFVQKQANITGETKILTKIERYKGDRVDSENPFYVNLNNTNEIYSKAAFENSKAFVEYKQKLPIRMAKKGNDFKVINYYVPETLFKTKTGISYVNYNESPLSFIATKVIDYLYTTIGRENYDEVDKQRFMARVWLDIHPEYKTKFIQDYTGYFSQRAGLFTKAYWGLFTLGTVEKREIREYKSLNLALNNQSKKIGLNDIVVAGNVSTILLLQSLIGVILSLFFFIFMIWSIKDAYRTSRKKYSSEELLTQKEYFKDVYEKNFEYIVLSPALFVISFISIMPILFGFILAFTSIRGDYAMTGKFNYVGFTNFFAIFNTNNVIGQTFGKAFWRVLLWTFVWAFFSTFTVFFGGFFQALILNNRRVVFRKFWRTLLILPWAIPALLSQMIFQVFFNETGYFNQLLQTFGINDLLRSLGMIGQQYSALEGSEKLFYLGENRVQWFSNPYNTSFVRTSLIVVNIWLGFPYFMALMTGIMTSIDKTLYEAADIDGATNWQKLKKITMPLVLSSTAPILVMTFSGNFNNFGVIYFITQGGPNAGIASRGFAGDTDILISWMYKLTVDYRVFNYASVFSILIFIFVGSISVWNLSKTKAFKGDY